LFATSWCSAHVMDVWRDGNLFASHGPASRCYPGSYQSWCPCGPSVVILVVVHKKAAHVMFEWSLVKAYLPTLTKTQAARQHHHDHHATPPTAVEANMRRKGSDELPRFVHGPPPRTVYWRRRYTYYLICFLVVCGFLSPSRQPGLGLAAHVSFTVDWSRYAYSLHATDGTSLCHAVLLLDALARLGSKADRVLFYPDYWDLTVEDAKDRESQLLLLARDTYQAKLQPTTLLTVEGRTKGTRYTRLLLTGPAWPGKARHGPNDG